MLKAYYPAEALARLAYDRHVLFGYIFPGGGSLAAPSLPALTLPLGAAVALAGLGFVIARRNRVAEAEGVSRSWMQAVAEWFARVCRYLFFDNRSPDKIQSLPGGRMVRRSAVNRQNAGSNPAPAAEGDLW